MKKICHITIYPEQGKLYTKKSGVASYAKNLISKMPQEKGVKHIVIADKDDGFITAYDEQGVSIERCWDKGLSGIFQIIKKVYLLQPDTIHIQHEMSLFGLVGGYILVILLKLYTCIYKKTLVITSHSVVAKSEVTRKFLDANNQKRPVWFAKFGFQILYRILTQADSLIVHEEIFRKRLAEEYGLNIKNVQVIPHGIDSFERLEKTQARNTIKHLIDQDFGNKKLLFTMGYVAGYKDIELLIRGFAEYVNRNKDRFLILGAGVHPKLKNDIEYMNSYNAYKNLAEELLDKNSYSRVGFVDDPDIPNYYSAADLTIYPYKVALASSGPMAISIGYHTPFVASECFAPYFQEYPELIFESSVIGVSEVLSRDMNKNSKIISILYHERIWEKVSERTNGLYTG